MSKIVQAITASPTGKRTAPLMRTNKLFWETFSGKDEFIKDTHSYDGVATYKIDVTLGNTVKVPESAGPALSEAIKRSKQQVIEAIFGEFREDFRLIERAIYDYDYETAKEALRNMEQKMFTDE